MSVPSTKNCPFCGSSKIWCRCIEEDSFRMECNFCKAIGPESMTENGAKNRWNNRYKETNQ